jgi:ABC-type nitrate/sulfonate/bicarbonate transport system substrate-binding protein
LGAGPTRVGVPSPSASYFPLIVAWKKGFYAQEGIQPEFIMMRPSIVPAALANGENPIHDRYRNRRRR